jgi:hypothetical protein
MCRGRMDGFCNQNASQLGSLAGQSFAAVYVGVVECMHPPVDSATKTPTSSCILLHLHIQRENIVYIYTE